MKRKAESIVVVSDEEEEDDDGTKLLHCYETLPPSPSPLPISIPSHMRPYATLFDRFQRTPSTTLDNKMGTIVLCAAKNDDSMWDALNRQVPHFPLRSLEQSLRFGLCYDLDVDAASIAFQAVSSGNLAMTLLWHADSASQQPSQFSDFCMTSTLLTFGFHLEGTIRITQQLKTEFHVDKHMRTLYDIVLTNNAVPLTTRNLWIEHFIMDVLQKHKELLFAIRRDHCEATIAFYCMVLTMAVTATPRETQLTLNTILGIAVVCSELHHLSSFKLSPPFLTACGIRDHKKCLDHTKSMLEIAEKALQDAPPMVYVDRISYLLIGMSAKEGVRSALDALVL